MLLKGLACSDFGRPGASCTLSSKVAHQALQGFVQCSAHTLVHAYSWAAFLATLLYTGTLRQLYRNAMQMEVDFFSAQPGVSSAPSVGMLVIDFDDTCTATDTTSQVFNTAIAATVEASPGIYAICTCTHRQLGPMSCHIEPAALDMHATMTIADLVTVPESDKNQHASMHLASRHILCYPLRQTGLGATKAFPCCTITLAGVLGTCKAGLSITTILPLWEVSQRLLHIQCLTVCTMQAQHCMCFGSKLIVCSCRR